MKDENTHAKNPFTGKWEIRNIYRKQNRNWLRINPKNYESDAWEFSVYQILRYPSENNVFEGKMIRYKNGRKKTEITFFFFSETSVLHMYDPEYKDSNVLYTNKYYKVIRFDDARLWLFDLHRASNKPDDDFLCWIDIKK